MFLPRKWLGRAMVGLLVTTAVVASPAQAKTYPTGPVRFISPLGAGGATDVAARLVAEHLGRIWGEQTLVVN
jgi:tripartite-type tricarboxylate transporter receptor subunit TctC